MRNTRKNVRKQLVSRAKGLVAAGYSVIPILGDLSGSEPKKPSVRWRAFQKRIAETSELRALFDERAGALGLVCGQVSRLLVIDFDDHLRYQRYCRHLPQYADTYTVKTRRGFHMYYRTGVKVPTHQFDGGDIKGEKSYVVAAPSVIGGFEYGAIGTCPARELSREDVDRVLNYFHARSGVMSARAWPMGQRSGEVNIVRLYEKWSGGMGRNNALFRCASLARELGMSKEEAERRLLRAHVEARAAAAHKVESVSTRFREGRATIKSAFAKGGSRAWDGENIPNSVRERLLSTQRSSVTARLLDILNLAGWRAESFFSMNEAFEVARAYGLNRKSVMAALSGDHSSFNGRHIVARRYVEYLDIGGLKRVKRGRPVQLVFQVPSPSRLLSVLGVGNSPSDRLSRQDVLSSRAYRLGLHREYVKRLSPDAAMGVLASRVGVSARTLQRYNSELGVHACAHVGRFRLSWESLKCLPRHERGQAKNQTPGYWLAIGESARFPAWRHIGASLLRRGVVVMVCMRRASTRSLGKVSCRRVVYEAMKVEEFLRLRLTRLEGADRAGWRERLAGALRVTRERAARLRYVRSRLDYDTVAERIAEDKVAETINGYLVARDGAGAEVRRPARRGVAYRMLKEFGVGNVYLALRESYNEAVAAVARHMVDVGEPDAGASVLARSMA